MIKLNNAQSRHLASSLRAYGIGQLAAFGYTGISAAHWLVASVSIGLAVAAEYGALTTLKDVEDNT